jgi:hypothetical protein
MCEAAHVPKVEAFIRAGKEAKRLLLAGVTRAELRDRVSESGRRKFWQSWLD